MQHDVNVSQTGKTPLHQQTVCQETCTAALGMCCIGTSKSMQGIFSLMLSFESITNPALQRQLLQHSLDLLELSRESAVQLLSHEAESAGTLMGLLREHAPDCPQDDHLLMLQGPLQDLVCKLSLAFKKGFGSFDAFC